MPSDNAYLSITGRACGDARSGQGRGKSGRRPTTCGGRADRTIRTSACIELDAVTAELWDGPASSLVAAFEFAKAKITGEKPNLGENRKKTVTLG